MYNFDKLVSISSDEKLLEFISEKEKHHPELIECSVRELKRRGRNFSKEDLEKIQKTISENSKQKTSSTLGKTPSYFSQGTIILFSIIFSPLSGAVLLASNIFRTTSRKGFGIVLLFGFVFSLLSVASTTLDQKLPVSVLILNVAGGIALSQFFWKKYIGENADYERRPIWQVIIPFLVFLVIELLVLYLLIASIHVHGKFGLDLNN
jgi:hypothetical protein